LGGLYSPRRSRRSVLPGIALPERDQGEVGADRLARRGRLPGLGKLRGSVGNIGIERGVGYRAFAEEVGFTVQAFEQGLGEGTVFSFGFLQ